MRFFCTLSWRKCCAEHVLRIGVSVGRVFVFTDGLENGRDVDEETFHDLRERMK